MRVLLVCNMHVIIYKKILEKNIHKTSTDSVQETVQETYVYDLCMFPTQDFLHVACMTLIMFMRMLHA